MCLSWLHGCQNAPFSISLSPFLSPSSGSSGRFGGQCQHFHSDQLTDMNPLFPFVCVCVCGCLQQCRQCISVFMMRPPEQGEGTEDTGGAATGVQRHLRLKKPPLKWIFYPLTPTTPPFFLLVGTSIIGIHPQVK